MWELNNLLVALEKFSVANPSIGCKSCIVHDNWIKDNKLKTNLNLYTEKKSYISVSDSVRLFSIAIPFLSP